MKALKILMFLVAFGAAYHLWHEHRTAGLLDGEAGHSAGEFVPTAMPDGAPRNTVIILAPLNCPSKAAQRADALAGKLTRMGIPNTRGNSFSLHIPNPTTEDKANMDRAASVLGGEIPAVFVNGLGKANPSVEEVADAYHRTQ